MIVKLKPYIFITFIIVMCSRLEAKEDKQIEYLKYVNEVISDFVKEITNKYNLYCSGSGGSMPRDVEEIKVLFISYQHSTVEDTRKIVVGCTKSLLHRINSHEKLRCYLRKYPFDASRIGISISFRKKTDEYYCDGSVALVHLSKNKIFYRAAEIQIKEPIPTIYVNENKEVFREFTGGGPSEELIPLKEETFEEALKILGAAS